MKRHEDWVARLFAFVESRYSTPFAWGSHDCAAFAIAAVEAMTGDRVLEVDWDSEASAARAILKIGGGDLIDAVSRVIGEPAANIATTQRGDVVAHLNDDGRMALGICLGDIMVAPEMVSGVAFLPMARASRSWAVGR